jgi:hypothetical protein
MSGTSGDVNATFSSQVNKIMGKRIQMMSTDNLQNREIKSPEFIKAERELESLINYFNLMMVFIVLYFASLVWRLFSQPVNVFAYLLIGIQLVNVILLVLCRRDLVHRKKRALQIYLGMIGFSYIATILIWIAAGSGHVNWLPLLGGLFMTGVMTIWIYSIIKKGVLV